MKKNDKKSIKLSNGRGEQLKIAGLFAGIGGIEKGLNLAGHSTEVLCEIDENAQFIHIKKVCLFHRV